MPPAFVSSVNYYFDGANFSMTQLLGWPPTVPSNTDRSVAITGTVQVRETDDVGQKNVRVDLKIGLSHQTVSHAMVVTHTNETLGITLPAVVVGTGIATTDQPRVDVQATVYIKRGAALGRFGIESTQLGVEFLPGTDAPSWTAERIVVESDSGNISTPTTQSLASSRSITIITKSGNIHGDYDLLDLLYMRAESGNIKVGVHARAEDPVKPAGAQFVAVTYSGNIDADMLGTVIVPDDVPDREYLVRVAGGSGSIRGRYLLGHDTDLNAESGSITATLVPVAPLDEKSRFTTRTESGSTNIYVLSPLHRHNGDDKGRMQWTGAHHYSKSGSMKLRYPPEWEGRIGGRTSSGSVNVHGQGLEIISQTPHAIEARRGQGHRSLTFETYSGSVNIDMS